MTLYVGSTSRPIYVFKVGSNSMQYGYMDTTSGTKFYNTVTLTFANGSYGSWYPTTSVTIAAGSTITNTVTNRTTANSTSTWVISGTDYTGASFTRTYTAGPSSSYYYTISASSTSTTISSATQFKPSVSQKSASTSASWHIIGSEYVYIEEDWTPATYYVPIPSGTTNWRVTGVFGISFWDYETGNDEMSSASNEINITKPGGGDWVGLYAEGYLEIYEENGYIVVKVDGHATDMGNGLLYPAASVTVEAYY